MTEIAANYYQFTTIDGKSSFTVLRGFEAPKLLSVGGRWTVVERPRRSSITQWQGDDPYRMSVPILFDGFDGNSHVDGPISVLVDMWQREADLKPPKPIYVYGALPVRGIQWVIESVEFGDNVLWIPGSDGRGHRIRQDATVNLLQYITAETLQVRNTSSSYIYQVKKGDTLSRISNYWYGTPKYASMLQKFNKIRDVKKLPKNLRIPPVVKG